MTQPNPVPAPSLADDTRAALYETVFSRRDVRAQFLPQPIPDKVLSRILLAAHHAPSVGYMQPWSFLLIRSDAQREAVHGLFCEASEEAAQMFENERATQYRRLKLEGIRDCALNLCVTCDRERAGPVVLGRTHQPQMDLYSTVCAVQNLWLAARAEGVGVGWVSIMDETRLSALLALPESVVPVAYLCLGYVEEFLPQPELERAGWRRRLPLDELVHAERWEGGGEASLREQLRRDQAALCDGRFASDCLGAEPDAD